MAVNARWVTINGKPMLSITLPDKQHVTIDKHTAYTLLLFLRFAVHGRPDNDKRAEGDWND